MLGVDEYGGEKVYLTSSDPIVNELNKLQNQLRGILSTYGCGYVPVLSHRQTLREDKDRETIFAWSEIKALKATEALKDKAVVELSNELRKLEEKLRITENLLEQKNLEIKKAVSEKKEALCAQFAAEATVRRVHANQKEDDGVPVEALIAPLESEIKIYKNEIARLQEDKKALERLTKSKEAALLEAEKILKSAMERALIVEEEENRILDKTNRQKIVEVEKLGQTIRELEEAILASGGAANAIRDYQRQISELHEEKRTLERELARVKVSANRVATVVANEWKDDNDKVMPVKQWLEERRLLQGEIQRLKDKLAVSERTAKAEAQLKDKVRLRLKTLEEGLKHVASFSASRNNASYASQKMEKSEHVLGFLQNNGGQRKRSTSQPRASFTVKSSILQQPNVGSETAFTNEDLKQVNGLKNNYAVGENMLRNHLWAPAPRNKFADDEKENTKRKLSSGASDNGFIHGAAPAEQVKHNAANDVGSDCKRTSGSDCEDVVSGLLYDKIQREVINLRKLCEGKDRSLIAKDEEIKMLIKKVETLTKAMETESKKLKREAAAREKEIISTKVEDNKQRSRNVNISRRSIRKFKEPKLIIWKTLHQPQFILVHSLIFTASEHGKTTEEGSLEITALKTHPFLLWWP
ncbi:hypothetical protein ACLOJK_000022 [Asimina triloba]